MQVWWTLKGDSNSTVYAHDVAKGITTELPDICSDATISCLGLDRAGRVWMGCQGGLLQVWCPVFQSDLPWACFVSSQYQVNFLPALRA